MDPKRIRRKPKDSSPATQPGNAPSPTTQPESTALVQSVAPPAIRLSHSNHPATKTNDSPANVEAVLSSPGQPLDSESRRLLESRTGHDLSKVRVHTDQQAEASARALDALAYTAGSHIVFGSGQYAPHSLEGKQLLAHEAAHALHQEKAGTSRSGVAPPGSIAERRADEFAASFVSPGRGRDLGRPAPLNFREWGEPWHIHRQTTIRTRGTVEHTGQVGGPAPGESGVPIGNIEVRRGEELEEGGVRLPNRLALEYGGSLVNVSRWLQFVWFEMIATTPAGVVRSSGNIPTTSGTKPFTTDPARPSWSVDSGSSTNPFYESAFRNIRTTGGTTIFDAPGGASAVPLANAAHTANPTATATTFVAHFESYLIQNNVAAYRVAWTATTTFTRSGGTTTAAAIIYNVQPSGPVTAIPTNLRTILRTSYSSFPGINSIR